MVRISHEETRRTTKRISIMILFEKESYDIMGALMEVHRTLGSGFLEAIYQEAVELELTSRGIPFEAQRQLQVTYKGQVLRKAYQADVVCHGQIIIEIKATETLTSRDEAQLINYLKATGFRLGILVNFGSVGKLEWKRIVN
jgi:GxxExxY protein